jgi:large subunit ribosomal protein L18
VFRSNRHIYAQIVDDERGHTIAAASSGADGRGAGTKTEVAGTVGAALARKAIAAGVKQVVFDRGGYRFHGRVSALANAAREEGLEF